MSAIERESVLRTASFYREYWLPNLERHHLTIGPKSAHVWYQTSSDDLPPNPRYLKELDSVYAEQIFPKRTGD